MPFCKASWANYFVHGLPVASVLIWSVLVVTPFVNYRGCRVVV